MAFPLYDKWLLKIDNSSKLDKFRLFFDIYLEENKGVIFYLKDDYNKNLFNFNIITLSIKKISPIDNKKYGRPVLGYWKKNICIIEKSYKNISKVCKVLKKITAPKKLAPYVSCPPPYS